ncbi:hypothetical protein OCU04_005414 [Sclerotinia nivalis]|uniref:Uncharacterized protein n=1 Tax=Sclerotinia nivalis TaxID=352851 RepID=A0A9X0APE1_9HELO|nr:hypothetical protein OCU04_005414 [Sclerotinia nivalis]
MASAPPPPPPLGAPTGTYEYNWFSGFTLFNPNSKIQPVINGAPASKLTDSINAFALLPILRRTIMRPQRNLLLGPRRVVNEEAWLATQVGTLQNPACHRCNRNTGPFTDCVVVQGRLKEACSNCYYGGSGSKCSLRHDWGMAGWISD